MGVLRGRVVRVGIRAWDLWALGFVVHGPVRRVSAWGRQGLRRLVLGGLTLNHDLHTLHHPKSVV